MVHILKHFSQIEWLFAFEIQCNAFVPVFFLLYVVQYLLLPLLLQVLRPPLYFCCSHGAASVPNFLISTSPSQPGILALLMSNILYAAAASW
jgi:hypothetical protein